MKSVKQRTSKGFHENLDIPVDMLVFSVSQNCVSRWIFLEVIMAVA